MKALEDRLTELEAIVRAQGAMLMSLLTAAEIFVPGIAAEAAELAENQARAGQGQGEGLAAFHLFQLAEQATVIADDDSDGEP